MPHHRSTVALVVSALIVLAGCSLVTAKREARTVLDVTKTLCILEHVLDPTPIIATLCAIEKAAEPEIERLISAHRAASAREVAAGVNASASASSASPPVAAACSSSPAPRPVPSASASVAPTPSSSAPATASSGKRK